MANIYGFSGMRGATIPGGVYGNVDDQFDIFQRLLSPEEWLELTAGQRASFQNYMDYVNQQQKHQRQQQRMNPRTSAGGVAQFAGGGGAGTTTRFGTRGGTGGIPKYRTVTDIRGNVSFQPVGGKRDIGGDYIPKALEDVQDVEGLRYAIPKMQEQSALDFLNVKVKRVAAQEDIAMPKREMERRRLAQYQQGIEQRGRALDIAQQRTDQINQRFYDGLSAKEKLARLNSDLRKGLMERTYELKGVNDNDREEFKLYADYVKGNVPNTPESIAKNREYAERAMAIADNAFDNAVKMEDKKEAAAVQRDIRNYISRLKILKSSVYGNAKADIEGQVAEAEAQLSSPQGQPAVEVEQAQPDGRIAIFDKNTKRFIRWK